ncbi:phage head closure protein [Aromatoleum toluolicum]|nr:phage head closure protein [Aromatoleum toluolicum]NMF98390.2 phage head closure protein [Aromatoleum toluolicum]
MDSRRLNRKVTIQRQTAEQDAAGQPLTTWGNLIASGDGKVWANILHLSGSESIKANADASTVRASIRIRYRTDVDAGMRVMHGAVVYDIKAALPDEVRREYVDLVCEAVR